MSLKDSVCTLTNESLNDEPNDAVFFTHNIDASIASDPISRTENELFYVVMSSRRNVVPIKVFRKDPY